MPFFRTAYQSTFRNIKTHQDQAIKSVLKQTERSKFIEKKGRTERGGGGGVGWGEEGNIYSTK